MKEVIERCNWLINKCNDKAITPDVKDDFRYLLEEIERQKEIIRQLDIKNLELTTIIKEVREYITSYESIDTIQQNEHSENNKDLDEKTMIEMVRRYMIVHDKVLEILDKVEEK